jgi:flagellar FliJ protein
MAFRFNLEAVLKFRKRLEDAAQREFAEAQAAVNEILDRIEKMYQRVDEVRAELSVAEKDGSPSKLQEVRDMNLFIIGQRRRIEETRLEARRLITVAEDKQENLIAAAREKKIMVKLKERRLNEYRERLKQIEAKEMDDLTMVRQAWGKR